MQLWQMLEAAGKLLDTYKLTGQQYLYDYIALIKAIKEENTDETLRLCKDIFPKCQMKKLLIYILVLSRCCNTSGIINKKKNWLLLQNN